MLLTRTHSSSPDVRLDYDVDSGDACLVAKKKVDIVYGLSLNSRIDQLFFTELKANERIEVAKKVRKSHDFGVWVHPVSDPTKEFDGPTCVERFQRPLWEGSELLEKEKNWVSPPVRMGGSRFFVAFTKSGSKKGWWDVHLIEDRFDPNHSFLLFTDEAEEKEQIKKNKLKYSWNKWIAERNYTTGTPVDLTTSFIAHGVYTPSICIMCVPLSGANRSNRQLEIGKSQFIDGAGFNVKMSTDQAKHSVITTTVRMGSRRSWVSASIGDGEIILSPFGKDTLLCKQTDCVELVVHTIGPADTRKRKRDMQDSPSTSPSKAARPG